MSLDPQQYVHLYCDQLQSPSRAALVHLAFLTEERTESTPSAALNFSSINKFARRKQPESYLGEVVEYISYCTFSLLSALYGFRYILGKF